MTKSINTKPSVFGIINVYKPKGITSHKVVQILRKIISEKQIGHTGTLDPLAVGVLPVCTGKATRIIEYLDTSKSYRAEILLGVKTDTYDTEGQVLLKHPVSVDVKQIKEILADFIGEINQKPPMYSAVHYQGKRLYEYARKNIQIEEIPSRTITIYEINIERFIPDEENPSVIINIDCSGGTYIRTVAHDIGEKLGCGACLKALERTRSGKFLAENSFSLEAIENFAKNNQYEKFLFNPAEFLKLPKIEINSDELIKIQQGQQLGYTLKTSLLDIECNNTKLQSSDNLIATQVSEAGASKDYDKRFSGKAERLAVTAESNTLKAHSYNSKKVQLINNDMLVAIATLEENLIKPLKVLC